MHKEKIIYLTTEQQEYLHRYVRTGTHPAKSIIRAKVLLQLDCSNNCKRTSYKEIAENMELSPQAVYNMRDDFLQKQDMETYLTRKKRDHGPRAKKLDTEQEVHIIALACSEAPAGYSRWSVALLKNKAIELKIVDSVGDSTIERLLKKRNISLI